MALERPSSAIRFMLRIKMQHYSCDLAPVSTYRIRVEQAQIRDDVLFVVDGQYGIGGRGIGDMGFKRRLLHGLFSQQVADRSILRWSPWRIDDAHPRSPALPPTTDIRRGEQHVCFVPTTEVAQLIQSLGQLGQAASQGFRYQALWRS